jgi:hypothetical protein
MGKRQAAVVEDICMNGTLFSAEKEEDYQNKQVLA